MSDTSPQKRTHHSHRISNLIRDDIMKGVFPPGARLKTEDLAARYAVSANPVREALWRLHGEGFVVTVPNQGARVRIVDDDFVRNIYELRRLIEPHFVRRFCARASREGIDRLQAAAEDFAREAEAPEADFFRMDDLNRAFHGIILEDEPNVEAIRVLETYAVFLVLARSKLAVTRGRLMVRVREHAAIVDALAEGDADKAAEAADRHILSAAEDFLDQLRHARMAQPSRAPAAT
ncbi:GntR family transcriptional regulator [Acuticoccus sp. M5D2P5]|uniref:GntR family transcriptional regulator n=1 Tax=Acuticoccus kalidii TaxID=2910977 RepID=UPI001F1679E3|nr:GntR family transcriptional regulator [Acuticoccus kalidii]MCF3934039.1 GntR family transcriptional regulator [Acuticoccus kalidii]